MANSSSEGGGQDQASTTSGDGNKPMREDESFRRAVALQQAGRLEEAAAICRKILETHPRQFNAIHLLGILEFGRRRTDTALRLMGEALRVNPSSAPAHFDHGNMLRALGYPKDALTCYDQALALRPNFPEALASRGDVLQVLKRPEEAVESYNRALTLRPKFPEALNNRGNALQSLQRIEEALASYEQSLALRPKYAAALNNRGNVLRCMGRLDEALESFRLALSIRRDFPEALNNQGNVLLSMHRFEEAISSYEQSLVIRPDDVETLNNLGNALLELGRAEDALAYYDRALLLRRDHPETLNNRGHVLQVLQRPQEALDSLDQALTFRPDFPEALNNRGIVLQALKRPEEALVSLDEALALRPNYVEALGNRGAAYQALRRLEDALASYSLALTLDPDHAETHWNESLCLLLTGDFTRGWQGYEWRWKAKEFAGHDRVYPQPRWLGVDEISGKTILLWTEQGFGDTIQFCRYVNLLVQREAKVILEVHRPLKALLGRLAGSVEVFGWGEPLPPFDFHCPLMSLPLAFKTTLETIPADGPYLSADPQKVRDWSSRLGSANKRRVGLVWSGSPGHTNDAARSIPLAELLGSLGGVEASFVSLQKELRPHDQAVLAARPEILHFGESLRDFDDTAALIQAMDLVISVDTSVAHLAGALGKPVWILLPYVPDWRWLLDREDSPWYPTARLFRQTRRSDWEGVLRDVADAVRAIEA